MHPQSFLIGVIDEVFRKYSDIGSLAFILPNNRSIRLCKKLVAQKLKAPIFSPHFFSVEQFIQLISAIKPIDEQRQQIELYTVYKSLKTEQTESFAQFLSWCNTALGDFNEIDRYLVESKKVFTILEEIGKIQEWNPSGNATKLMTEYTLFTKRLGLLYADFQNALLNKAIGPQGLQYRVAAQKVEQFVANNPNTKYVFVGLNALNKAEKNIIGYLLDHTQSHIFWDVDEYFYNDKIHDASYFLHQNESYFSKQANNQTISLSNNYLKKEKISIVGTPKNTAQAQYVGQLLEEIYDESKAIAMVLADESLLPLILNAIPEHIKDFNVSMGYPLHLTQSATFFISFFKLEQNKTKRGYHRKDVIDFLSLYFCHKLVKEEKKQQLQEVIHKNNLVYVSKEVLQNCLYGSPIQLLFKNDKKPSELIPHILELLQKLNEISMIEKEAISQTTSFLLSYENETKQHDFLDNLESFQLKLIDFLSKNKVNFKGNPDKGLQIMGLLESRALDFETIIVTSMNEGILPAGKSVNSFIPYDVKKELGLPAVKEKDAIYSYHFYRLLQRAKNVHLTYNTEPDVLNGGEPSRFIYQILADPNLKFCIEEKIAKPRFEYSALKPISIFKTDRLLADLNEIVQNGLSPSSLSDYIKNPYTFYKKNVLKIRETEEVDENMAYNVLGTIIHDSIEALYQPLCNRFLKENDLENVLSRVEEVVLFQFQKHYAKAAIFQGKNLIIYHVIIKYVSSVVQKDRELARTKTLKILEQEESLSVGLRLENSNNKAILKGKIDRVDELNDITRIIDYKTGKVEKNTLKIDTLNPLFNDPKYNQAFQLLCYALMKKKKGTPVNQVGILAIKKTKDNVYILQGKNGLQNPCSDDLLNEFETKLIRLYEEILNPDIPFTDSGV